MPHPLYFHPFLDKKHSIGGGIVLRSSVSLRWVAPTFARKDFLYLWQLKNDSRPFAKYIANTDRIYVMGHCEAGEDSVLTTESGSEEYCDPWELAKILCNHGLPPTSQAHIRIHACNSATPREGPNFATKFAKEMAERTRYHVTIRGYDVAVGMYLGARLTGDFGSADKHAHDYRPPQGPTELVMRDPLV